MEPEKWEGILAAAAKTFGRHGFKKASIDGIAAAAGVAKGTVYLGCESKRDLFSQAILRELRRMNAELARGIDPRVPAEELLVRVTRQALAVLDRYPLARDLILGIHDQDLPDWVDRLDELRAQNLTTCIEILRIGIRQGRFRPDLYVEEVAGLYLDLVTITIMYHTRGPDASRRLERRLEAAFDVVLKGILAPSSSPPGRGSG